MLKRLRVDNFKSLINVTIEPSHINLLTGRNNSGKTTTCQAFKFLRNSVNSTIMEAAALATGDAWNITNAYLNKDIVTFEADCEIDVENIKYEFFYCLSFKANIRTTAALPERELSIVNETLSVSGGRFETTTFLMYNEAGNVRLLHEGKYEQEADINDAFIETTAPTNATMLSRLYDLQHNRLANAFKRYLGSWLYYDFDPANLRSSEARQPGLILSENGSNLSSVIYQLKSIDEKKYRDFVNIVKEVEPKLYAFNFPSSVSLQDSVFMFLTDDKDNKFSVSSISNGTLRFMAIVYVLLVTQAITSANKTAPPLVIIEEPENGIYATHLKKLKALFDNNERSGPQLIFSSHSPYFIDLFDDHLDGVFVVKSDNTHSMITKPDENKLEAILQDFDLGEAHFRELLA